MAQQPQPDITTVTYRIEAIERDVRRLQDQLATYVPARENDLRLTSIQETVRRIEQDVIKAKEQLQDMNIKLTTQEQVNQSRDAAQSASRDKTIIRVLWGAVSFVLLVLSGVLIGFFTHLFGR